MLRKVMLLAAMLAMVLAVAAPALAQDATANDGSIAEGGDVQYVDCSQVQQAIQGQYGDANAAADDNSVATAANTLGISQTQVNACLGEVGNVAGAPGVGDNVVFQGAGGNASVVSEASVPAVDVDDDASVSAVADDEASASASASATAAASAPAELPETGGASLLALGAGALLVAGGLVARRIVR